ncbi:eukaryotic translation initiation factor 2A-like isoform X1 [Zophobas morio]|uniref:eukaryotic translation initiation factor 2A-like isoform X1 n=1 Tax=Zophobas morio TaxID=2755281 RepID=UPI003082FB85
MFANEIYIYKLNGINEGVYKKLRVEGLTHCCWSSGSNPSLSLYILNKQGKPEVVQIRKFNNLEVITSQTTFFGSKEAKLLWNKTGSSLLVRASLEEVGDKKAYMGNDAALFYLSLDGRFNTPVNLQKSNQLHDVAWSPTDEHLFIAVFDFSPAKVMAFGKNCVPLFSFESSAFRNSVMFSKHGNLVCLAGFGNLRGTMEFWDVSRRLLVSRFVAEDTTAFYWFPDSEHVLTSTTSPRLRTDNQFKIWHYSGQLLWCVPFDQLLEVCCEPAKVGTFPLKPTIPVQDNTKAVKKVSAFRPSVLAASPDFINQTYSLNGLERLEASLKPCKQVRRVPGFTEPSSTKSKPKKKEKVTLYPLITAKNNAEDVSESWPRSITTTNKVNLKDDPQKLLKNLRKKHREIVVLKDKQLHGAALNPDQVAKVSSESKVLEEITRLENTFNVVQL